MVEIVKQIIEFYYKNKKKPEAKDLNIWDIDLLNNKAPIFITLYKDWKIRWASWTITEQENNIINELIENTIQALTNDKRFDKIIKDESNKLQIRVDKIINRKVIDSSNLEKINPIKNWVIVIKKDYSKLATILPNISSKIDSWNDYYSVLSKKLWETFKADDYIIYKIETNIYRNF